MIQPGCVRSRGMLALALLVLAACSDASVREAALFVERTNSGIDFHHHRYTTRAKKYLPETLGAGVGVLDYDLDGRLDLYFVQGAPLPGYDGDQPPAPNRLFRNEGGLRFRDVTAAAGVGDLGYGMGVTCPDYDGDGDPDLYVTNVRGNVLYRNQGDGTFQDVTAAAGIGDTSWSTAAGWADYDRDGDLDLYLANYAVCDFENYTVCRQARKISYCHPDTLLSSPDRLFENRGDGTFVDVTEAAGIVDLRGKGLAVVPFDHDGDGWIDWFVSNDSSENFLWRNRGDGTFEEIAHLVGVAVDGKGQSQACMGTAIGDVDGDLDFDIFAANFGRETNVLYRRVDADFYEDSIYRSGQADSSYFFTGFGSELFDMDRDGDLDLIVVNGHIMDIIEELDPAQTFEQVPQLFENLGSASFREVSAAAGPYFQHPNLGRGLALADLDDDGDLDAVISNNDYPAAVLENRALDEGGWLGLRLVGTVSPADAIGTWVEVEVGDLQQVGAIHGSTSYLSFRDLRLFFGTGSRKGPAKVRIHWTSGRLQELDGVALGRYHTVREPGG